MNNCQIITFLGAWFGFRSCDESASTSNYTSTVSDVWPRACVCAVPLFTFACVRAQNPITRRYVWLCSIQNISGQAASTLTHEHGTLFPLSLSPDKFASANSWVYESVVFFGAPNCHFLMAAFAVAIAALSLCLCSPYKPYAYIAASSANEGESRR